MNAPYLSQTKWAKAYDSRSKNYY